MQPRFRVEVNGEALPKRRWSRSVRKIVARANRRHFHRPRFGGVNLAAAAGIFTPVLRIYNTVSSPTETVPAGAINLTIELWGGGPVGGGAGTSSGGGGSGAGGYCRTTMNVGAQGGKTFSPIITSGGGTCSITAGTVTGFATMTGNQGGAGTAGSGSTPGNGGGGGTASGGTAANTTGGAGANGAGSGGGVGGTPVNGTVSGDGGPYGRGGTGATAGGAGATGPFIGAAVFAYT